MHSYEKTWFIRDQSGHRSFQEHFRDNKIEEIIPNSFTFNHFQVRKFFSDQYISHNRSTIGRILN